MLIEEELGSSAPYRVARCRLLEDQVPGGASAALQAGLETLDLTRRLTLVTAAISEALAVAHRSGGSPSEGARWN